MKVDIDSVELFGGTKDGADVWESGREVLEQFHWQVEVVEATVDTKGVLHIFNTRREVAIVSSPPFWRHVAVSV